MISIRRFGRRLELPPTAQLVRELRMFCHLEEARARHAGYNSLPESATWEEIEQAVSSKRVSGAAPLAKRSKRTLNMRIAQEGKVIADNPAGGSPSPAAGMASLRRGLAENNLRTLNAEKSR